MDELHWYALNYRTAVTQEETENAWKDLVTYIKERIAGEREACAEVAAWILKMPENDVSAAIRARGARMINLTREEADGYYCEVCGKFLPLENGVIVHDDVPHPADMKFNDKETTQ